jgi:hypothetical protein
MPRADACVGLHAGSERRMNIYVPAFFRSASDAATSASYQRISRNEFLRTMKRDACQDARMSHAISAHNKRLLTTMKISVLRPLQRSGR